MKLEEKLFLDQYRVDNRSHLKIKDPAVCLQCKDRQCTVICPAGVYKWDAEGKKIVVGWENCMEMGACIVACNEFDNIEMTYPRGGYGIRYKFG